MRVLTYSLEEAWLSLRRSKRSALLSIVTIAGVFTMVGAFLLVFTNVQRLVTEWSASSELSVYLSDNVTPAQRDRVEAVLKASPHVAAQQRVSKDDALRRFTRDFPDLAADAATGGENPFPASIDVRLRERSDAGAAAEQLGAQVRRLPGVADVRFDRRWLDRLHSVVGTLRWIGLVIAVVLVVGALLTVANVVRLACYARRDEIEIMELVGAPLAYVRGPFVMEGLLQGGLGALVALTALWVGFMVMQARWGATLAHTIGLGTTSFLPFEVCGSLLIGGAMVGCIGGFIASLSPTIAGATSATDAV